MEVVLENTGSFKKHTEPQVAWEDGGQNDSMLDLAVQETFHLHCYIWMCDLESIFSTDFLARCEHKAYSSIWNGGIGEDTGKCRAGGGWLGLAWQGATAVIKAAGQVFQDQEWVCREGLWWPSQEVVILWVIVNVNTLLCQLYSKCATVCGQLVSWFVTTERFCQWYILCAKMS